MQKQNPATFFNQEHASQYDKRFVKLAPLRDALNLIMSALFADLPTDARILCVGAGTGSELIYLAEKFPHWNFTAVEPSGAMLDVCRRRTEECGIASRCVFHEGFLDSLPPGDPFDAATSLLVSQFILEPDARSRFFRGIAERLRPDGRLVSADLASDLSSTAYEDLLYVWFKLMLLADIPPENLKNLRAAYGRDVAVLPVEKVSSIIEAGGFNRPVVFLQTALIFGWYAKRAAMV